MSATVFRTPTSRCRIGVSRCDITPPVGIYHRFWGAARHDQATGVHRPLSATVLAVQSLDEADDSPPLFWVAVDHCLFRPPEMDEFLGRTARLSGIAEDRLTVLFSHTHSGGHIARSRSDQPGGDLIGPYLDSLPGKIADCLSSAAKSVQPGVLTYGQSVSSMGHNRDYWDAAKNRYVCGFNPEAPAGLPVHVVRATDEAGKTVATIVNYPCHPTTLAWENTLISPDYVGALRETVEVATKAPCVFLLAPCGDIGPKVGFVGDPDVADRNGRQLAYAALEALESMAPPLAELNYQGPVLSGATLGDWRHRPLSAERLQRAARFRSTRLQVPLPYRGDLEPAAESQAKLARLVDEESAATESGDADEAQRLRALAERQRRLLERTGPLPDGTTYPYQIRMWQIGDAIWIALEGEPYYGIQQSLTERFPDQPLLFLTLTNGSRSSYLPTRESYGRPLYQVDVAVLDAGCLEAVLDEVARQIDEWAAGVTH